MRLFLIYFVMFGLVATNLPGNLSNAFSQAEDPGILDGLVFIGHVGPKGRGANGEDEVVFQNGRFLSTSCVKYGFKPAPYTAYRSGESIIFTAVTHSPKHGKIEWQGRITDEEINASYRWTKHRWYWFDADEENWLTARLKKD